MTISFPASLDSLSNPAASDPRTGHAAQHADVNDAIEAIEAVIGTTAIPGLARLGGVAGGQTLTGGTAASETLSLSSTSHATKGKVLLGTLSAYDEATDRLGVGTTSPSADIHALCTTEQLRLGYDVANYLSMTVGNAGEAALAATGGTVIIQGTSATDGPTLGSELLSTAGWTVPGGWTESPDDAFTHSNGGGTSALSHSASITSATKYQVSWTITGRTTGSVNVAVGGQTGFGQSGAGSFGPTTTSTAAFTVTPTNDFDGTISALSCKAISSASKAIFSGKTSGGTSVAEIRAGLFSSNIFVGLNAGRNATTGFNIAGLGTSCLQNVTTGNNDVAVGNSAGSALTVGTYCTLIGQSAGAAITTGNFDTCLGANAGLNITTSSNVVAIGYNSGRYQADGSTALAASALSTYMGTGARGFSDSDSYSIVIGANAVGLGANTTVLGTINQTAAATIYGAGTFSLTNATTNAAVTVGTLTKNVTGAGVGAAGLGPRLTFAAESSTTADTTQADITATWTDATHATRKSRLALSAYDTAAREGLRLEADGSVARLGFFGVTAVVRPTALTTQLTTLTYTAPGTPDYAIADVTQTTPWGFASGDEARTVLSVIKNLQDRVAQLESKLQGLGLLT